MRNPLSIKLGQINPTIGDMEGNIALMSAVAAEAQAEGVDMVVFPELALTGYTPGDLLADPLFAERLNDARALLCEASRKTPDVYWVVGQPLRKEGGASGSFYNGVQVLLNGVVVLTQSKQSLSGDGVFDEHRHFSAGGESVKVLRIRDATVGFLIGADAWCDGGSDCPTAPLRRLADASPDLVVSLQASPSSKGARRNRHQRIAEVCTRYHLSMVCVAQVGGQDHIVFDGGSFAVDAEGTVLFEAKRFEPDAPTLRFELDPPRFVDGQGEALAPIDPEGLPLMEFYRRQAVVGLRDYARRCGFKKALVGSSGGIDSALTIALAAEALGAENVVAITMPSVYSSEGSVSDSVTLCGNLGVTLYQVPIRDIVSQFSSSMEQSDVQEAPSGLALENLQARVRGTLLMTYSNQYGPLLLTTGNKSEASVGYCTLYGDTNGGLGLIGDLYKTEVFALSRHINDTAGRELIPNAIIDKPPSAELAPGQKDSDALPPYEVLDDILKVRVEGPFLEPEEREAAQGTVDDLHLTENGRATLQKVEQLIARSEYKRRQSPPIIRMRAAPEAGRRVFIVARQY
ncbi:NAD+ synthase [Bordetella sp. 15P40C-2]|uniref:NAD+ synthase n=1 Tax=Bordetella sp. 15P40C-2 TaxID=2572246 RepID=UPI00132B40F9|nr:NAD+ synthase [Bordetella sp. 15P40C-2]MVW71112.1 NAD+ synthase [Bordetella sp. 15P40C-2]